jgi:hypothetical protein
MRLTRGGSAADTQQQAPLFRTPSLVHVRKHTHPRTTARVKVPRQLQLLISGMCSRLDVDGLRGDLVINRAAKALVAFEGGDTVTQDDVGRVISGCLNHRCAARAPPLRRWWARHVCALLLCAVCAVCVCVCVPGAPQGAAHRATRAQQHTNTPTRAMRASPHLTDATRLRKDPLDPIDSGTKVQILFKRLTDPEFARREAEAKKKQVCVCCVELCVCARALCVPCVHTHKDTASKTRVSLCAGGARLAEGRLAPCLRMREVVRAVANSRPASDTLRRVLRCACTGGGRAGGSKGQQKGGRVGRAAALAAVMVFLLWARAWRVAVQRFGATKSTSNAPRLQLSRSVKHQPAAMLSCAHPAPAEPPDHAFRVPLHDTHQPDRPPYV